MKKVLFALLLTFLIFFSLSVSADENIPRQEFIQMINSALLISSDSSIPVSDVPVSSPYFKDIRAGIDYGYLLGDENGNINPKDFLTRAEASVILGRIMGTYPCLDTGFNDDDRIHIWAKPAVKSLTDLKIITGHDDFTFRCDDFLTKEQAKIIISRMTTHLYGGGNGTKDSPYIISSVFHLRNIELNPDKHYKLKSDLNLKDCDFIFYPIKSFGGSFNGGGFKITGLDSKSSLNVIFENIKASGKVTNIKLSNPDIHFAFAHKNEGLIENCANISNTNHKSQSLATKYTGNICNINVGSIKNCYNTSLISCSDGIASGICGINEGEILNCFNTGDSYDISSVGICALNYGNLENCFNTGVISGSKARAITMKESPKTPQNCYYSSKMFSSGEYKVTENALITIFMALSDFELTDENNFPTLKSNVYFKNENFKEFGGGDGSKANPYIISEKEHFLNIKNHLGSNFKQTKNISFENTNQFDMIGNSNKPFSGTYDGSGYNLSNLIIYSPLGDSVSLFENNAGTIKNVNIRNFIIYANNSASSLVLNNSGLVTNCSSDAYINCASGGGLVMNNLKSGTLESNVFYGTVSGKKSAALLAYLNAGLILNCEASGTVTAAFSGGISYKNEGTITSSCCFGFVGGNKCGLLAFENLGEIHKSYYLEGTTATSSTVRNIEAFPRSEVQAKHKGSFELLDFDVWRLSDSFPELIKNPKEITLVENTTDFAGGTGSFDNPFKIVTPMHFVNIAKYPSKCFILLNDINLSHLSKSNEFKTISSFSGYLNGNNHTISGLNQKNISSLIDKNYGIITKLTTSGFTLYGKFSASFVLENNGVITLCRNDSNLIGQNLAGIAYANNSTIQRCVNNGNLKGNTVGGICVVNTGEISDCLLSGDIIGSDSSSIIFGIASGGNVLSSITTSDLYFENGIGKFYPVSDAAYTYCYYLDRYNQKWDGNVTFVELFSKKSLPGINFYDIWENVPGKLPFLKDMQNSELKTPEHFTSGDGSKEHPFVILTLNDLYNIRMYPSAHFTVLSDIVAGNISSKGILNNGGKGFAPIENFNGTILGNNSIIYGIEILYSDLQNSGLVTQNYGTIKDLGFSNVRIEGDKAAGSVCGINYGNIINIKVLDSRIGSKSGDAGSVSGINYGNVTNCTNYSDIFASVAGGGIVGVNHKTVAASTNWGGVLSVAEEKTSYAGGISGKNFETIEKCVNNGKVFSFSNKEAAYSGGITGLLEGQVKNCYNTGDHSSKSPTIALAGGIAGGGDDIRISNVYNIGYGLTSSNTSYVGSIVGSGSGYVSNSYYDHTLPSACGGENINEVSVLGISSEDFSSLENLKNFSKDIWTTPASRTYYYPQLKENLHITKTYSENVRDFAGGNGSITNPYIILTAEHLDNVRKYLGSTFTLMGNIDMRKYIKEHNFSPIGDNIFGFFGTFLGNGYEITGLEISGGEFGGLFAKNHGEIYDLTISDAKISGKYSGAVCGLNTGLIYRCSNQSEISNILNGYTSTGGIAGINKSGGMLVSCSNTKDICASSSSSVTGGISGANHGIIAGSINYGSVSSKGSALTISGGVTGTNSGTVSDSANILNVYATTSSSGETLAGGISGANSGTLVNCYSASDEVNAKSYGGICANNTSAVINCYYNNNVDTPCSLGTCHATSVEKQKLADKSTFTDFNFDEMWYATGEHFPIPLETLY